MLKEQLIREYNLGEELGYEQDMLDELIDYSGYICDNITYVADNYVNIYDHKSWEIAPKLKDYIEDSMGEFGIPKDVNLIDIFRQGQFYYNDYLLYDNLDDIIWNIAVIKLDELIEGCGIELPAYDILASDMENYLHDYIDSIDNNNRVDDIEDMVENMFKDYLKDKKYKEELKNV